MIGLALIIVSILAIGIYVLVELKRLKHQVWAIAVILLLLFGYVSFTVVLRGHEVDYKSASGLMVAGKIYFSWLAGIGRNMIAITGHAVKMDWGVNESNTPVK